jgi:hypothetical protein
MLIIEKQEELINKLQGSLSLISSRLLKIIVYKQNELLCIDVEAELIYKKHDNKILLKFIDVTEYSFFYTSNRFFYNVEIYKFFKTRDLFYISFDPIDEIEMISEDDQDYIKAHSVEGYILN